MASGRQHAAWPDSSGPEGAPPERLLVGRILTSQCLEKSARMRDFLAYVCDRALANPEAEIREQEIGCAVFNREPDYDTNQDNIVRVNASHLRKKLEAYFASEGAMEPLVLELPKGQYRPLFHVRSESAAPGRPRRAWRISRPVMLLALICAILAAVLILTRVNRTERIPAIRALWSQLIRNDQATAIVLSDSSLGLLQDLTGNPVPLAEYIHPDLWRLAPSLTGRPDAQTAARMAARRHHTDMAGVHAAQRILAVAGADQERIALVFARDFNLRQMKSGNVVLLGSRRTNPWVEIVESRMHFRYGFDAGTRQGYFENPHPGAGELPTYANDPATSYCQVTFLPNPSGTGKVLVISGTDVEGTEAGAEFLTSAAGAAALLRQVAPGGAGQFPYFEALLKSARLGGTTPGCEIAVVRSAKN